MTPKDALIRGGHKNPEQILADLERGGCIALSSEDADEYNEAFPDYTSTPYIRGFQDGYDKAMDIAKVRFDGL